MTKFTSRIILISILVLAFFLRLFRIDQVPARLTHDEMSLGYNAYSILKTGKDEWGRLLPLDFEAFGDHKLPAYIYLSVPFIALLGLTPIATKMVSLISGILVILLLYKLTKLLLGKEKLALITSLCMAISPWAIHISRMALESHLALAFFMSGLYFFIKGWKENKRKIIYLSSIFFGLTFYTYIAYRLIIVLLAFIFGIYLIIKERKHIKTWMIWGLGITIVVFPLITLLFTNSGTARLKQVSLFSNPGIVMTVDEKRSLCYLVEPNILPKICSLFFHKPSEFIKQFTTNYFNLITPEFLFISGDKNIYLANPGYGEFIWLFLPFYIIGFYILITLKGKYALPLKLSFFIAPIPSALVESPQIVRASLALPLIVFCIGLGLYQFIQWLQSYKYKRLLYLISITLITFFNVQYFLDYFYIYPAQYDNAAYPFDQRVANYIKKNESQAEKIFIDKDFPDSYILFAFYNKFDPAWLQQNIVRNNIDSYGFSHPKILGKMEFVDAPYAMVKSYLCQYPNQNYIFISKPYLDTLNTETYYNFVHVHPQVSIFNTKQLREILQKTGALAGFCGADSTL